VHGTFYTDDPKGFFGSWFAWVIHFLGDFYGKPGKRILIYLNDLNSNTIIEAIDSF
jgi:hypothetical protein